MSNCFRTAERRPAIRRVARQAGLIGLFVLSTFAAAGPYADLDARQSRLSDKQIVAELRRIATDDPEVEVHLNEGAAAARAYVDLRATLEGERDKTPPRIGTAPGGERLASSWLARALGRIEKPKLDLPRPRAPHLGGIGPWATILMWIVLGGLLVLAVYLLARYARFPANRRRKAIVDPQEPMRSADEWLDEADAQIGRGEYRAAVRGLFVAGLMRFDEAGVARFDRHQTNWEHLRRIESSPKAPADVGVRDATVRFDRLWYGLVPATEADAHAMRAWYDALVRRLAERRAAEPGPGEPRTKGADGPGAVEARP